MRILFVLMTLSSGLAMLSMGCDQLNKPMPVTTGGSSSSASGAPARQADAGTAAEQPAPPGEEPRVTPQPGDTQL